MQEPSNPWALTDGDEKTATTFYGAGANENNSLICTLDLGAKENLEAYRVHFGDFGYTEPATLKDGPCSDSHSPRWYLDGSIDASAWTSLASGGGYVNPEAAGTLATTARYLRFRSESCRGLSGVYELAIFAPASSLSRDGFEADVAERPDAFSASVAAHEFGHRVEISGLRTATTSTFANPDGSRELLASTFVRNLPGADGLLQPVDPTVSQALDGSFLTGPHPLRPRFAAMASSKAVTVSTEGGDIQFGLASALSSVGTPYGPEGLLYANVAAGVDLSYQVLSDTLKETLILASQSAGSSWTFDYSAPGMIASQNADGTIVFQDATSGAIRAVIPEGAAWDSAETPSTVPVHLSLSGTGPSVKVLVSVDPLWLAQPGREFPVHVDPGLTATQGNSTAFKSDGTVCTSPTCAIRGGNSQSGTNGANTYWRSTEAFKYNAIFGKHVVGATISETVTAGTTNCYTHTWYTVNAENYSGYGSAVTSSANVCSTGSATGTALVNTLQGWADTSNAGRRLFFRVSEQSGVYTYKQVNATLAITYNSYPNPPGNPSMSPVAGSGPSGYLTSSATPTLKASVSDPDNGNVRGLFEVYQGSTLVWSGYSSPYVTSGGTASITVPAAANLVNNVVYTVRVWGSDGTDKSKAWSNYIQFKVDTVSPGQPTVSSSNYPAGAWSATSTTADNVIWNMPANDVTGYYYGLDSNPPTTWTTTPSLTWNPPAGWHAVYVQAVDGAGNRSATTSYSFGVGAGALLSPADQDRTQDSVRLSSKAPSGYSHVRYDWAPGTTSAFAPIPSSSITLSGGGTATPSTAGTYDVNQALTWRTIHEAGTDGLLQVRACFATSATVAPSLCTVMNGLQVVRTSFGASYATRELGPGTVSLLTGDMSVSATDASLSTYGGALTVSRTTTTLNPPGASSAPSGAVGPGWTLSLPDPGVGRSDQILIDESADGYVVLRGADGAEEVFEATGGTLPRRYSPIGDASDGTTLVENPADTFTVTDTDGTTTTFVSTGTSTPVAMSSVTQPGVGGPTYLYDGGLLSSVTGQSPPGVSCSAAPLTTPGCRSLRFRYGAPSGTAASLAQPPGMFDATGRLAEIDAVITDPVTGTMTTTPLARYGYDGTGSGAHLVGQWDPRISPKLVTGYSYGGNGNGNRLATLTPPGLNAWQLGYDTDGRVKTVTRHDTDLNQDAISTIVYRAPWNGSDATSVGLPDLSKTATSGWGQNDDVVENASAVFGPDHIPAATPTSSDWRYADVAYLDVNGREVNTASFGAGAWQIDTTGYDQHGKPIWQLTADNRNQALNPTPATDPAVAALTNPIDRASALSTLNVYTSDGADLISTLGPKHPVTLSDGSTVDARSHTVNTYDAGAPGGAVFHLLTSSTVSAQTADGIERDSHTTRTGYAALASGDGDGWALRLPTSVTTVVPGGTDVTRWTRYDTRGRVIESRLPMGAATSGVGTDARGTVTRYYAVGAAAPCSDASLTPDPGVLYAGLACQSGPAGQPSGSLPSLPTSEVTGYTMWQQPTTVVEKDASRTLLRTTTTGYDAAGRNTTSSVVTTAAVTGGNTSTVAVPATTTGYDPDTGLPTTLSSTAGTITTGFDSQGRVTTYVDAGGNLSRTSYDLAGRVATRSDGKATYGYHYDNDGTSSTEHRGMLTQLDTGITASGYSGATSYAAVYDAEGRASTVTLPNGTVATNKFDNAGEQTALAYTGPGLGSSGLSFTAAYDSVGRKTSTTGPLSTQTFTYTGVGELAASVRNAGGVCTSQAFGYNANSDRTAHASNTTCTPPGGALPVVHSYDDADRLTDAGLVYDQLGRTTSNPTSTVTGGAAVTVGYFDNDMVQRQVQGTHTQSFTLDPSGHRIISQTDSVAGVRTNSYADAGDSPAWTATANGGWTRNIAGLNGLGAIETFAIGQGNTMTDTVALQLTDLTGNVVATVNDSAGAIVSGVFDYDPFGANVGSTPAPAKYGWLGGHQRAADDLGGLVLMGYRLYNPATGRFLQVDPVVGGNDNAYVYPQDPINDYDLDGRMSDGGQLPPYWHQLNQQEQKAFLAKNGGDGSYDRKAFKSAEQKRIRWEKTQSQERNKAKRAMQNQKNSGKKGSGGSKLRLPPLGILGGAWWYWNNAPCVRACQGRSPQYA